MTLCALSDVIALDQLMDAVMWHSCGPGPKLLHMRDGHSWRILPSCSFCLAGSWSRFSLPRHGGKGQGCRSLFNLHSLCLLLPGSTGGVQAGDLRHGRHPLSFAMLVCHRVGGPPPMVLVGLVRQNLPLLASLRCCWSSPGRSPFMLLKLNGGHSLTPTVLSLGCATAAHLCVLPAP